MAKDPYQALGVNKTASAEDLKRAFREAAKKYHPDKTRGDKAAEVKFKEINGAYDLLSDPDKRKKFDRGEIDAAGNPTGYGSGFGSGFAGAGAGAGRARGGPSSDRANDRAEDFGFGGSFGGFNAEDLFADLFGGSKGRSGGSGNKRGPFDQNLKGEDLKYDLNVTLFEAVRGGTRRVTLANGKTFDVTIPSGTIDGQTLRLKGLGEPGRGGAIGDALITLRVEPHAQFTLKGLHLYSDAAVGLHEAVLGGEIEVPTLDGTAKVRVPKGANTGTQLRLKGKGATNKQGHQGDQYITLKIVLPAKVDDELSAAVEKWAKKHAYNPRKK